MSFLQQGATLSVVNGTCSPTISGVTAGNALICEYGVNDAKTLAAPTDSAGQTWLIRAQYDANGQSLAIAYLLNANAGTHTLTWATTSDAATAAISEWNGITSATGGTAATGSQAAGTSLTSGSYTPAQATEVVIAVLNEFGSNTNDGVKCTTVAFQAIGTTNDGGSEPCIALEQNGATYNAFEANAQITSSATALTAAYSWTPSNSAIVLVAGFAYSAVTDVLYPQAVF